MRHNGLHFVERDRLYGAGGAAQESNVIFAMSAIEILTSVNLNDGSPSSARTIAMQITVKMQSPCFS